MLPEDRFYESQHQDSRRHRPSCHNEWLCEWLKDSGTSQLPDHPESPSVAEKGESGHLPELPDLFNGGRP